MRIRQLTGIRQIQMDFAQIQTVLGQIHKVFRINLDGFSAAGVIMWQCNVLRVRPEAVAKTIINPDCI